MAPAGSGVASVAWFAGITLVLSAFLLTWLPDLGPLIVVFIPTLLAAAILTIEGGAGGCAAGF